MLRSSEPRCVPSTLVVKCHRRQGPLQFALASEYSFSMRRMQFFLQCFISRSLFKMLAVNSCCC
ncbi:hypothetical protein V3C99_006796 [Haemonchus contortus]|uniref:Ovule protein n=1 Tax=Haemonchus contortus TaxID=6289 RepID=A0A7I4YSI3_HAECO